jgi:aspartate/methionine/tyrosine aminotransferase
LKEQGKPVIGFGAGEPDFPTPAHVIEDVKLASRTLHIINILL